ncbi:hypothetical protein ABDD95_07770 [Mucilaginibacter sp. PAMB04274]|uniref:hypothetical protein n=1 Tax=Mucilaginibacter sp. PAMB04274 TaxID=3138568 RepID=UPI0031F6F01D
MDIFWYIHRSAIGVTEISGIHKNTQLTLKMNFLEEWYNSLQLFKWQHVLVNDPHFRNIEGIRDELAAFLPAEDLESPLMKNHDSWLLHILADKQPNSIYLLNEVAELLRLYKTLPDHHCYNLVQKNGRINYKGFNEKLFELHVNYLLRTVGLDPQIGKTYLSDGRHKEIDILMALNGQIYNVEITRYYDVFTEELLAYATDVVGHLHRTTINRTLMPHEIFSGYMGFKKRDDSLIRQSKELFNQGVKSFLHGYRSAKDNVILHPAKKETDTYVFNIEPTFSQHYEKHYEELLHSYPGYIKFKIEADLKTNKFVANAFVATNTTVADVNKRLVTKIREKLAQHKTYKEGNLVIVLGIERVFSSFSNNRAIPITQKDIDARAIHEEIRGRAAVVLLFKELNPTGISYQKMVLGDSVWHHDLFQVIERINPNIRYLNVQT